MLKRIRQSLPHITSKSRSYSSVKRKYPINPEESKKLPIFDYGVSKESYQRVFVWGNVQTGALGVPYLKRKDSPERIEYFKCPKRLSFAEKYPVSKWL